MKARIDFADRVGGYVSCVYADEAERKSVIAGLKCAVICQPSAKASGALVAASLNMLRCAASTGITVGMRSVEAVGHGAEKCSTSRERHRRPCHSRIKVCRTVTPVT